MCNCKISAACTSNESFIISILKLLNKNDNSKVPNEFKKVRSSNQFRHVPM